MSELPPGLPAAGYSEEATMHATAPPASPAPQAPRTPLWQLLLAAALGSLWLPAVICTLVFAPVSSDGAPWCPLLGAGVGICVVVVVGLLRFAKKVAFAVSLVALAYGPLGTSALAFTVNDLADMEPARSHRVRVDSFSYTNSRGARSTTYLHVTQVSPPGRRFRVAQKASGAPDGISVGNEFSLVLQPGALGMEYLAGPRGDGALWAFGAGMTALCALGSAFAVPGARASAHRAQVLRRQAEQLAERAGFLIEPAPQVRLSLGGDAAPHFSFFARLPVSSHDARPALYRSPAKLPYAGPHGAIVVQLMGGGYRRLLLACFLGERHRLDIGPVRAQLFSATRHRVPGSGLCSGDPAFDARYQLWVYTGGSSRLGAPATLTGTLPLPQALRGSLMALAPSLGATVAYDGAWMTLMLEDLPNDDAVFAQLLVSFEAMAAFVPDVLRLHQRV